VYLRNLVLLRTYKEKRDTSKKQAEEAEEAEEKSTCSYVYSRTWEGEDE